VDMAVAGAPLDDPEAVKIPIDAVTSDDYAEGVAAFLEKRPAQFAMELAADFPPYVARWPHRPEEIA
jgi:hypothetical protein